MGPTSNLIKYGTLSIRYEIFYFIFFWRYGWDIVLYFEESVFGMLVSWTL